MFRDVTNAFRRRRAGSYAIDPDAAPYAGIVSTKWSGLEGTAGYSGGRNCAPALSVGVRCRSAKRGSLPGRQSLRTISLNDGEAIVELQQRTRSNPVRRSGRR